MRAWSHTNQASVPLLRNGGGALTAGTAASLAGSSPPSELGEPPDGASAPLASGCRAVGTGAFASPEPCSSAMNVGGAVADGAAGSLTGGPSTFASGGWSVRQGSVAPESSVVKVGSGLFSSAGVSVDSDISAANSSFVAVCSAGVSTRKGGGAFAAGCFSFAGGCLASESASGATRNGGGAFVAGCFTGGLAGLAGGLSSSTELCAFAGGCLAGESSAKTGGGAFVAGCFAGGLAGFAGSRPSFTSGSSEKVTFGAERCAEDSAVGGLSSTRCGGGAFAPGCFTGGLLDANDGSSRKGGGAAFVAGFDGAGSAFSSKRGGGAFTDGCFTAGAAADSGHGHGAFATGWLASGDVSS